MIFNLSNDKNVLKLIEFLLNAKDQSVEVKIHKHTRTNRQNRALHLYFDLLSEALNGGGFDMRATIKKDVEIPFTPETVKSHLWKPIMEAYLEKSSTTELRTNEISEVFEILNRHIGERTSVYVPFPNWDYGGYE